MIDNYKQIHHYTLLTSIIEYEYQPVETVPERGGILLEAFNAL